MAEQRIWLYCICRNEEPIMPYFLRHYSKFVHRMTFFDDKSTDRTREIIASCPKAICVDWPGEPGIVDDQFLEFANETWKEARGHAEWVIWVDADEFLYHPDIVPLLERYYNEGVEVPQISGYTMVSDHFPTTDGQIYDEVKTGFADGVWDKKAIFRVHMYWNVGRHSVNFSKFNPKSSVGSEIKLLHYRVLGWDYLVNRHTRNWERVPERCRRMNFGTNCSPGWPGHHGLDWFKEKMGTPLIEVV